MIKNNMALEYKLLIGVNGSGKTHYIQEKLKEIKKNKELNFFYSPSEIDFSEEYKDKKENYSNTIKNLIKKLIDKEFTIDLTAEQIESIDPKLFESIEKSKNLLDELRSEGGEEFIY
jgi:predicted adenine nucleotide alpha hydrolase (AANH) superfamily ATPase